ncbi:T3SS effector HopA1 family protein [Streptomyces sp. NPDC050121]|uniref:T3SS effector HopA1 family protein n=1 Tax=Streptomyces sp. NPDC050121 TaxID=3365601 RepID=UPI0037B23A22
MTTLRTDPMPLAVDGLAPRLARALSTVHIADDGLAARVGTAEVTADTPVKLRDRLAVSIYENLHAGRPGGEETLPRTLRDTAFEQPLHEATPHTTTPYRARVHGLHDDQPVMEIEGVRVLVPATGPHGPTDPDGTLRAAALRAAQASEAVWADLVVPAARPALSPGFFLADGSRGRPAAGPVLRLYTHITQARYAADVWGVVLGALESAAVPYRAKVSSSPLLFPRRDALVVYLDTGALHALDAVREAVRDVPGLGPDTSPFTYEIAPGFAAAWEPDDDRPGRRHMSFGEHRSALMAQALVEHALSPQYPSRDAAVAHALREAGVDPAHPARGLRQPHADPRVSPRKEA